MLNTIEAIVKNGQIVPIEEIELPEGSKAFVTILNGEEKDFWLLATEDSLKNVWENEEDDIYAQLLS
jgi:predicted DNA-binding antitoxin AbrB/MazE fold protein